MNMCGRWDSWILTSIKIPAPVDSLISTLIHIPGHIYWTWYAWKATLICHIWLKTLVWKTMLIGRIWLTRRVCLEGNVDWPSLVGHDKERVAADNAAAEYVLGELRLAQRRGCCSVRENPFNSLHWCTPTEVSMFRQGTWWDTCYHACCLMKIIEESRKWRWGREQLRITKI